ncbi:MAG: PTS sugar transporter subunit IIA [Bacteroidota bacterium]
MNVFSLLTYHTVHTQLDVDDKFDAINALVDSLSTQLGGETLEKVREAVLERERIMSTGVGKGLAIPHAKTPVLDTTYAAFALLNEELDYDSLDGNPVRLIFLLVGPTDANSTHIKMLSRISRLMNSTSFRERLVACITVQEVLDAFQDEEEKYFVA